MSHNTDERGFALMMTLWVMAVLGVLLLTMNMTANSNVKASGYLVESIEPEYLLKGGFNRVAAELVPSVSLGSDDRLKAIRGDNLGLWKVSNIDWSVTRIEGEAPRELSQSELLCVVSADDARLPLAMANKEMLSSLPSVSPVLAEEILRYRDARKDAGGIRTVDELITLKGMTSDLYYGKEDKPGLGELLTVYSTGKIYINGARPEVLELLPEVGKVVAREIAGRIEKGNRFEQVDDLNHVLGVTPKMLKTLKEWVTVTPSYYRIICEKPDVGYAEGVLQVRRDGMSLVGFRQGWRDIKVPKG